MLHKVSKLEGFHIVATDGEIGHVDDVLVDEQMNVQHLLVDTSNWIGGDWVLIPPASVVSIDSPHKRIRVSLSRDQVAHSPSVESANIELIETLPPPII